MASHGVPRTSAGSAGKGREAELQKIQEYRSLVDQVNIKMHDKNYTTELFQLTSQLLEWNPEFYTIWNHRRRLLRHFFDHGNNKIDNYKSESNTSHIQKHLTTDLTFLIPLLRKFPKCYWIWNYRLWLLSEASRLLPPPATYKLWQQELALVGKMLSIDSRNFHGWGYRRKVVTAMEELSAEIDAGTGASMTEAEFEYTTRMIKSNLSNFSAWHRRSKLISKLLEERNATFDERRRFLDEEFQLLQRALYADPDSKDQSLWSYHQYLLISFAPSSSPSLFPSPSPSLPAPNPQSPTPSLSTIPPTNAPSILPTTTPPIIPSLPPFLKLTHLKRQITDLIEMLDGAENSKWIYQRLVEMSLMGRELDEGGRWPVGTEGEGEGEVGGKVVEGWVRRLGELDPLRAGRWGELGGRVRRG